MIPPARPGRPLSWRLVLFPPAMAPARRRRRLVFVALYAAVAAALVWPLYPLGARRLPPLFGLPPSFAWVVAALAAGFFLLLGLYLGDLREEEAGGGPRRRDDGDDGDGA